MKQHTVRGLAMIEAIAHNFGLDHLDGLDLLRHIAESHHETMDGGGYPTACTAWKFRWKRASLPSRMYSTPSPAPRPYKPS